MEQKLTYETFQQALKDNRLLGLRCETCGAYTVPPRRVCMECAGEDLTVVELSAKGTIRTFTVINVPPEGIEAPYIVGMAELQEGPWVMGNIVGLPPQQADMSLIGKPVKVGHKTLPGDKFSGGEKVAMSFTLVRS